MSGEQQNTSTLWPGIHVAQKRSNVEARAAEKACSCTHAGPSMGPGPSSTTRDSEGVQAIASAIAAAPAAETPHRDAMMAGVRDARAGVTMEPRMAGNRCSESRHASIAQGVVRQAHDVER